MRSGATHKPLTRALMLVAALSIPGWAEVALGQTVTVASVSELRDAVRSGAGRILVEPGEYDFTEPVDLKDVELLGQGRAGSGAGVTFVVDPSSPALAGRALLSVAGTVRIENIAFEGLLVPVNAYVVSAPAGQGGYTHRITIRGCRFVSVAGEAYQSVILGNREAKAGTSESPSWDVTFTDNYVEGGVYGVIVGNFSSDHPGARVNATLARNEFHCPGTTVLLFGALDGVYGTLTGATSDNVFYDSSGTGIWISGGSDFTGAGGSFARVDWTSTGDRFVNDVGGIAVNGGHRHANTVGPSMGNRVRVTIASPRFENCWRDAEILGSSTYGSLPANATDTGRHPRPPWTLGAGNTVAVTLEGSKFDPKPGRVLIKNHLDDVHRQRSTVPVPDMDPEPSYGNRATFTGSPRGFERANPGVNPIPPAYFEGGRE